MKTSFLLAVIGSLALFTIAGCANQHSTPVAATGTNPTARTYSREYLEQTGQPNTGRALQAADPAVQVPGGR